MANQSTAFPIEKDALSKVKAQAMYKLSTWPLLDWLWLVWPILI
jgi:hypothetical protein